MLGSKTAITEHQYYLLIVFLEEVYTKQRLSKNI